MDVCKLHWILVENELKKYIILMKHQSTWLSRLVLSVRRSFYKCNSRSSIKENSGSYTHKQALKKAVIVVTSILLAIFMPVIAIVSFFSGNISVDTAEIGRASCRERV